MAKEDDSSLRYAVQDSGDESEAQAPAQAARGDPLAGPAVYTLGCMGWIPSEGTFDRVLSRPAAQEDRDGIGASGLPTAAVQEEALDALLNRLLAAAHDGAWGFDDAAEHAQAQDIGAFLQRAAQDWRLCALELRSQISHLGGTPVEGGTPGGALQRGWQNLRAALPGYDDAALLAACEQLQADLLARLHDGLQRPMPADLGAPLQELERRAKRRLGQLATVRACLAAETAQQQ